VDHVAGDTGQMIVCGHSYATPSLVGGAPSPAPILASYDGVYGQVLWAKHYGTETAASGIRIKEFAICRYAEDPAYIVGVFQNDPAIAVFDSTDGTLLRSYFIGDGSSSPQYDII
jgi:hypothetical protein